MNHFHCSISGIFRKITAALLLSTLIFSCPNPSGPSSPGDGGSLNPVAAPMIQTEAETLTTRDLLSLYRATPDSTIKYTLDGSLPAKDSGQTYSAPFTLPPGTTTVNMRKKFTLVLYILPVIGKTEPEATCHTIHKDLLYPVVSSVAVYIAPV